MPRLSEHNLIERPDEHGRPLGRREARKRATRTALVNVAQRRFHDDGFEETTLDDICDEVGVSRRTFFRYFKSKEDLVFPNRAERLERFVKVLTDAPDAENPFETLRRATRLFGPEYMVHREQLVAQQALIARTPSLRAREAEIDRDWEAVMARTIMGRTGDDRASAVRARVIAGACIGVIRATMRHWFETGGVEDLTQLGEDALDCLERGFALR